ncbi:hypothetical protein, partial [Photobacterium sanguinicancri]|uniref:hypothetical protein n=1 Tax=Photobacterium sanguinicancri TaxID=875932 RepID=UPI002480A4B5
HSYQLVSGSVRVQTFLLIVLRHVSERANQSIVLWFIGTRVSCKVMALSHGLMTAIRTRPYWHS